MQAMQYCTYIDASRAMGALSRAQPYVYKEDKYLLVRGTALATGFPELRYSDSGKVLIRTNKLVHILYYSSY